MRRFASLAVLAAALVLAAACSGSTAKTGGTPAASPADGQGTPAAGQGARLKVVATTVQITALAREVGGDRIELAGLVPSGADPHTFEPRPSDLRSIEAARVILRNGIGLDAFLDDTLSAAKNATVVTVTDGIALRVTEEGGKPVNDPHVWHDPDRAAQMVDAIRLALDAADPANAATYDANAYAQKQHLADAKTQITAMVASIPPERRKMVTNHDAFGYFADAFGLKVVGAVIPSVSTSAEPSAQETAALLDTIAREGVPAIFAESSVNSSLARQLAQDAGVKIVDDLYGDSLGPSGSGADTVDGMLVENGRKISEALR